MLFCYLRDANNDCNQIVSCDRNYRLSLFGGISGLSSHKWCPTAQLEYWWRRVISAFANQSGIRQHIFVYNWQLSLRNVNMRYADMLRYANRLYRVNVSLLYEVCKETRMHSKAPNCSSTPDFSIVWICSPLMRYHFVWCVRVSRFAALFNTQNTTLHCHLFLSLSSLSLRFSRLLVLMTLLSSADIISEWLYCTEPPIMTRSK